MNGHFEIGKKRKAFLSSLSPKGQFGILTLMNVLPEPSDLLQGIHRRDFPEKHVVLNSIKE